MLIEATPVGDAALPVDEFKAHLRLGSGFGTDHLQDAVLAGFLRSAVAAIEGRTGKALFLRGFRYVVHGWQSAGAQTLPVAPVPAVTAMTIVDRAGAESLVTAAAYWLEQDWAQPRLRAVAQSMPAIPTGGSAVIEFEAGYGADWAAIPADLQQAVLLLAAHYYEFRHETVRDGGHMPFGVVSLIERYRTVRLSRGAAV